MRVCLGFDIKFISFVYSYLSASVLVLQIDNGLMTSRFSVQQ